MTIEPLESPELANVSQSAPRRTKSVWHLVWRDKFARVAMLVLAFLYIGAALADPLTPYSMNFNDVEMANAPPTLIHIVDRNNQLVWPYVFATIRTFDPDTFKQTYSEQYQRTYPIILFPHGESYKIFGLIPSDIHLFGVAAPARLFILGTDINGRDNFSRLFFGAQKSLTIGFLALLVMFPIGLIYGAVSGFAGGAIDTVMMRVAEAIMSIPTFYLLIGLAAIMPAGINSVQRFALVTIILSFIGWSYLARVIRGMVLKIREEEYVQAARAAGMSEFKTILRHVLPQTASYVIVAATLQVPYFILSESGLSFIGLGIQQPDASWGNMLKSAMDNVNDLPNQPWLIAPGILIFATILCFNTLGDTLRDVLDPKMQGQR